MTAIDYLKKQIKKSEELLWNARVADIGERTKIDFKNLKFFLKASAHPTAELKEAMRIYQTQPLPMGVNQDMRADEAWHALKLYKNPVSGKKVFADLASVMLGVLTIPQSNAGAERSFSLVKNVHTDARSAMKNDLLSALLTLKVGGFPPLEKETLRRCKGATVAYLNKD